MRTREDKAQRRSIKDTRVDYFTTPFLSFLGRG
jgi:hypothetical protein